MLKVSEIFKSIDGEGITAGYPAAFIRLYGCNLKCSYCDSMYACKGNEYTEMTIQEIVDKIFWMYTTHVTITGGEPLLQKETKELIYTLVSYDYIVNVETNGAVDISNIIDDCPCPEKLIITMDYKCASSGEGNSTLLHNIEKLRKSDVLKFVVGNLTDLYEMHHIVNQLPADDDTCNVFVSPVFGKIDPKDIVTFLLNNNLNDVRMQLQIHKLIWEPDKRGV